MAAKPSILISDDDFGDFELSITGGLPLKDINAEPFDFTLQPFSVNEDVWDEVACAPSPPAKRVLIWSDDEDDNSSSGSERGQKRVKTRLLSPVSFTTNSLDGSIDYDLPWDNYDFRDFRQHPEAVYVDKTRSILQLSDTFRHLLLRPPRFGKTAFLSTLNQYYDIHGLDRFTEIFGSLAVAENSEAKPHHSQHLCLSFTLSEIYVLSDITKIEAALTSHISLRLRMFIIEYAKELQLDDTTTFLRTADVRPRAADLFAKVFDLVRLRRYTLFVGVDDYDALVRTRSFAHPEWPYGHESFATLEDIEHTLDACLWGPLNAASDVIAKLLVTGTLSLSESPILKNLHKLDLKVDPSLQLSCGFTEQEALQFSRTFLDEPPSLLKLQKACGVYTFACNSPTTEPVLHPQQLILHIAKLSRKPMLLFTPESFPLLPGIFGLLPQESDVPGAVSINGLIDLLACGTVEIDDTTPRDFNGTAVTWRTLFDLGVLTYDRKGAVRVSNSVVLSLIHERVDGAFAERHDLEALYAYNAEADPQLILGLFSEILIDASRRALDTKSAIEPTMRGIFELVMRRIYSCQKIDPVILPPEVADDSSIVEITHSWDNAEPEQWALRTLTLRGMWHAASPNNDEPSIDDLRKLHAELICEDEARLLERPYHDAGTGLVALVGSYLKAEPNISVFLAVGGARVLCSSHVHT
ncbi:hypothetical protein B0H11DRAFT_1923524 [Mycena galericulata]|nr:hypothetical protein B0H11DRAFT_1923524 [Mycena galericulata]